MRKRSCKKKQLAKATSLSKKKMIQDELIKIEKEVIKPHQKSREDQEQKAVNALKNNPKYFYTYAKHTRT